MSEETGADVAVEVAGQKVNLRNVKSLNTLATVATLVIVILIGYVLIELKSDARAEGVALSKRDDTIAQAIREMSVSNRVLACLMATPQDQREAKLPVCERIAR